MYEIHNIHYRHYIGTAWVQNILNGCKTGRIFVSTMWVRSRVQVVSILAVKNVFTNMKLWAKYQTTRRNSASVVERKYSLVFMMDSSNQWRRLPRYWPFVRGIHRSPVDSPKKRAVARSLGVFFDLRRNKRLSKQSRRRWFETPPVHFDVIVMLSFNGTFREVHQRYADVMALKRSPHYWLFQGINAELD